MGEPRLRARFAEPEDMDAVMALRGRVFRGGGNDEDAFDAGFRHGIVEDATTGALLGCFRARLFETAVTIDQGYSAQFFDLSGLSSRRGALIEFGRFCVDPKVRDPDVLRSAMAPLVDWAVASDAGMIFGCASLPGQDGAPYAAAFAHVLASGRGIKKVLPAGSCSVEFMQGEPDVSALKAFPSLLRAYLSLGARVAPFAVPDPDLGTLVVFTALEVDTIPDTYRRSLLKTVHAGRA